jgi:predicted AAA+ superfamily ATPase
MRQCVLTELLREIASRNGQSLNASAIGRRMGLSCHAVQHRIAALKEAGMIRILPSLARRRPHVLLRDCRLVQALGASHLAVMRTCLTERITATYKARDSSARFFQWEAGRVKRIDLIVSSPQETVGFQFIESQALHNRDWGALRVGFARGIVDRGFVVHRGSQAFLTARVVIALPIQEFLGNLDQWLACRSFQEAHVLLSVLSLRGCT